MPIKSAPIYDITPKIANALISIEAARQKILNLPLTPIILVSLRESARLFTTHYSTMIEGNALTQAEVEKVIKHKGHFPGRERDEYEVKGYYEALTYVEQNANLNKTLSEKIIQTIHALVMGGGKNKVKPSIYRDGQNVIRDSRTRKIIYMPPEAKDVSSLMDGMVDWINESTDLPCALVSAIAHYQFATIHPYYDGNGRTARLLTTLILHKGGYDLKGLYSLEEYYARNLGAYYEAISVGDSHNYYMGRAESDITKWIEYFVDGMSVSFNNVLKRMSEEYSKNEVDQSAIIRKLDPRQRKVLALFEEYDIITSKQVGELFGFQPRTSSKICHEWVKIGFLEIVDFSKKARKYKLNLNYNK